MATSCSPSWGHRRKEKIVLIKSTKTQHKEILLCYKGYQKHRGGKKVRGLDLKIPTLPGHVVRENISLNGSGTRKVGAERSFEISFISHEL